MFAVLAAMGPIISNEFAQWDDQYTIFGNVWLNPPSWSGVAFYWQHSAGGLYVPLTYTFWSASWPPSRTSTPDSWRASQPDGVSSRQRAVARATRLLPVLRISCGD